MHPKILILIITILFELQCVYMRKSKSVRKVNFSGSFKFCMFLSQLIQL